MSLGGPHRVQDHRLLNGQHEGLHEQHEHRLSIRILLFHKAYCLFVTQT